MRRGHGVRSAPFPAGPAGGPRGPASRGWTLVWPNCRSPGPLQVPPHRRLRRQPPEAGGAGRTGRAIGTSVPSLAGCCRPPPCCPPGLQRALRATPGVPALPRFCSTCLHTGGISLVPWPLAPGGSGTDFHMAPSVAGSKGRLASGTVCGANARPGEAASRARVASASPRLQTASRCASAGSHACQCFAAIWRSGLPLHRRS